MSHRPFEEVVAEHGAVVMRVLRSYLPMADADDAWSDTFIAAMRAYPEIRAGSNVRGWLVTIARRKAIDNLRARTRAPVPVEHSIDVASVHAIPEPDEDLRDALATLTAKQRDAVVYHHVAGLPYADVGVLLGSGEAAARRSAADGVAKLRTAYLAATRREGGGTGR